MPNAGDAGCTTRRQNTHITDRREVCYPWHPWYGQVVEVVEGVKRGDRSVWRCRLAGDGSGRAIELPQWMLDRAACCILRMAEAPVVTSQALRQLRELLFRAVPQPLGAVENQQSSSTEKGAADVCVTNAKDFASVGTICSASVDSSLELAPGGRASSSDAAAGSSAAVASFSPRSPHRRPGGGR